MPGTGEPLRSPSDPPPRLGGRPLPPYRHVPGLTPHPVTHPEGHSYGVDEEPLTLAGVALPADWRACEDYLEGIDLFNRAFLWEAHEVWEAVWHAVGHETVVGRFLQGLIQIAAALLKRHLDMRVGVANLLAKSESNLAPARDWLQAAAADRFMGVDLIDWENRVRRYVDGSEAEYPFLRVED